MRYFLSKVLVVLLSCLIANASSAATDAADFAGAASNERAAHVQPFESAAFSVPSTWAEPALAGVPTWLAQRPITMHFSKRRQGGGVRRRRTAGAGTSSPVVRPSTRDGSSRRRWLVGFGAAAALSGGGGLAWWLKNRGQPNSVLIVGAEHGGAFGADFTAQVLLEAVRDHSKGRRLIVWNEELGPDMRLQNPEAAQGLLDQRFPPHAQLEDLGRLLNWREEMLKQEPDPAIDQFIAWLVEKDESATRNIPFETLYRDSRGLINTLMRVVRDLRAKGYDVQWRREKFHPRAIRFWVQAILWSNEGRQRLEAGDIPSAIDWTLRALEKMYESNRWRDNVLARSIAVEVRAERNIFHLVPRGRQHGSSLGTALREQGVDPTVRIDSPRSVLVRAVAQDPTRESDARRRRMAMELLLQSPLDRYLESRGAPRFSEPSGPFLEEVSNAFLERWLQRFASGGHQDPSSFAAEFLKDLGSQTISPDLRKLLDRYMAAGLLFTPKPLRAAA